MKDERLCRSITYKIGPESASQKVSSFLKAKGYSTQNRINLKKDPRSIWVNGVCVFQNTILQAGDELKVQIREQENSDGIVSVELPLDIVYEDEDLLVINKRRFIIMTIPLAMHLRGILKSRGSHLFFAVLTGLTGIRRGLPLWRSTW